MDLLDRLLEHDRWATARLLEACRGLSDAELDRPIDVGHETLRATFEHMIFNIAAWTDIMANRPVDAPRGERSLATLIDRHARSYDAFAAFVRQVRDEGRLDATFVDEVGEVTSFGGGMLHVILHNAEHRTDILHILSRLGAQDIPEVDHGLWDFSVRTP